MDGEAGWWTTSGNIGLPPLARVMGVGRQQQHKWRDRNNHKRDSLSVSHIPAARRLKSRHCFLSSVQHANFPAKVIRCSKWRKRLRNKSHIGIINLHKELAKGYDSPWTTWRCLNRLRTGYTCSKAQRKSGSSTLETPHVLVEKQKKPRHTCYSAPNSHIPASRNYGKTWFDDTTMMIS